MKALVKASVTVLLLLPLIVGGAPSSSPTSEADPKSTSVTTSKDEQLTPSAEEGSPFDDYEFQDGEDDLVVLRRLKRDFYDRDPWGRIPERRPYSKRRYGKRPTRYNTRRYSRGRRREHHAYRGPDYGDDFEETKHRYTNAGYIDTSAFDKQSKPKETFVSARSSGVARTESTGSSV